MKRKGKRKSTGDDKNHVARVINLKYIPNLKRYTTVKVEDMRLLQQLNTYPPDHKDYFWEHHNPYITEERLEFLKTKAVFSTIL